MKSATLFVLATLATAPAHASWVETVWAATIHGDNDLTSIAHPDAQSTLDVLGTLSSKQTLADGSARLTFAAGATMELEKSNGYSVSLTSESPLVVDIRADALRIEWTWVDGGLTQKTTLRALARKTIFANERDAVVVERTVISGSGSVRIERASKAPVLIDVVGGSVTDPGAEGSVGSVEGGFRYTVAPTIELGQAATADDPSRRLTTLRSGPLTTTFMDYCDDFVIVDGSRVLHVTGGTIAVY